MDSASSSRQSSKLSIDDKKRDKKHKKSTSAVEKLEPSSPNTNKNAENGAEGAQQSKGGNVTDFLNDPSLQTGIKHSLTRAGIKIVNNV